MNLKWNLELLDGRWRGPLINTCTDLPQPSCAAAEQSLGCSDMTHSLPLKVGSTQKPYPSWEIPKLGVVGIWDRYLETDGPYCWMWLYWGCCWIPGSLAVLPDELLGFAFSRSLGLILPHVRNGVSHIEWFKQGNWRSYLLWLFAVGQFLWWATVVLLGLNYQVCKHQ